jgi:tetratricopeptide (TPR) repeat protein
LKTRNIVLKGIALSPSSHNPNELPPEIAFISLPKALAQFHHLPLHVPVWIHHQARAAEKGYDFNEGVGVMEELLKQSPGVPGAYLYQLFVTKWPKLMEVNPYFESGRIAEAIPKLVEVLDIDPECPLTCFQLGYCFRVTGELEKSESFYKQALRMAPDAGWIYSNLGRTYQAMGDTPKAAGAFWKALELLPEDQFILEQLMALGEIFPIPQQDAQGGVKDLFVRRNDYEKAMEKALAREEKPENLMALGWKLLQDRLFDLARLSFEKARQKDNGLTDAGLGLGIAHLESGGFKEAEKLLVQYLDEKPDSPFAHLNLFKVYLAQGEQDLAWDEIQTAVRLNPDNLDALRQIYFIYRETGRLEEAWEWLDRLSEEKPSSFTPLFLKAQALLEQGRWEESEKTFRKALERAPHNEEILLSYSAELGKRGHRRELIELLGKEPSPLPFSLTLNLALAYSQMGKTAEAGKILEGFLQRPDISRLDKARAQAILKELK